MYWINKYQLDSKEYTFIEVKQKNIKVTFMDYGATIMSIFVPGKDGTFETIIMAYNNLKSYTEDNMYLNTTIGPTSGRIKDGVLPVHDQVYQLSVLNGESYNHHGGKDGIHKKFYHYDIIDNDTYTEVHFTSKLHESDQDYPGNQTIRVSYIITENTLEIKYTATTDQSTILNLTNHAYFNLSGNMKTTILNHELSINAARYLELEEMLPVQVSSVENTHLDFRKSSSIQSRFYDGILNTKERGIDQPFLLDEVTYNIPQAILYDPHSKREMKVYTTYPSIVCYTHNYPDNHPLLFDREHIPNLGVCLECQFPPNAMHIDELDNYILEPNQTYCQKIKFVFNVRK